MLRRAVGGGGSWRDFDFSENFLVDHLGQPFCQLGVQSLAADLAHGAEVANGHVTANTDNPVDVDSINAAIMKHSNLAARMPDYAVRHSLQPPPDICQAVGQPGHLLFALRLGGFGGVLVVGGLLLAYLNGVLGLFETAGECAFARLFGSFHSRLSWPPSLAQLGPAGKGGLAFLGGAG